MPKIRLALREWILRRALPWLLPALMLTAMVCDPGASDGGPPKVARKLDGVETSSRKSTLVPALDLLRATQAELAKIKDYTCTFQKRERVKTALEAATMLVKFRQEPHSVYMKFLQQNAGREVLYVAGTNKGQLLAHEGSGLASWAGTFSFTPDAPQVMKDNRYPITKFGMATLVQMTIDQWSKEAQYDEVQVKLAEIRHGETDCQLIEVVRPQARPEMTYSLSKFYLDKKSKLPVHVENYGFATRARQQPPLLEEYSYSDVKVNVGLTDRDFDRKNSQYSF